MSQSMFIHTTSTLEKQIEILRELGKEQTANAMSAVLKKVNRGVIKTYSELQRELEKASRFL